MAIRTEKKLSMSYFAVRSASEGENDFLTLIDCHHMTLIFPVIFLFSFFSFSFVYVVEHKWAASERWIDK